MLNIYFDIFRPFFRVDPPPPPEEACFGLFAIFRVFFAIFPFFRWPPLEIFLPTPLGAYLSRPGDSERTFLVFESS